jgi:hypothetical protein
MIKNTTKVTTSYELPICKIVDIKAEGVLCTSMQQIYEYEDEFEW